MNEYFKNVIKKSTEASKINELEMIQSLWSGYGKIVRYSLEGSEMKSVVVKHVRFPHQKNHSRGWNTDLGHQRKLKSYEVETEWYKNWSSNCDDSCRIPKCFALEKQGDEVLMVLEDLDAAGFGRRRSRVAMKEITACLQWLANFHATFLNEKPTDLWRIGTYWHLDTRPEELQVLTDKDLKHYASKIDEVLNSAKFQTIVHGDAKLANFCFSEDGQKVAAVDFQYVGGGIGMKDVAYFVGSCLYEDDCEEMETELLDIYFAVLRKAVKLKKLNVDCEALEKEWRELYHFAWTDFHRFLKGWSPGHWKINSYSERLVREIITKIKQK